MLAENRKTHFSVFFITGSAEERYVELNLRKKNIFNSYFLVDAPYNFEGKKICRL